MAEPAVLAFPRGVSDPTCPRGHVIETTTDRRLLLHLENTLAVSATTDSLRDERRLLSAYLHETCQHHWHHYDGEGDFTPFHQCLWCNAVVVEAGAPTGCGCGKDAPFDGGAEGTCPCCSTCTTTATGGSA